MIKEWQHNLKVACMDFTIQGFFHKNINTTLISQGESYDQSPQGQFELAALVRGGQIRLPFSGIGGEGYVKSTFL